MKIHPSLGEFLKVPKGKNLIVFSHKFFCDYLTPLSIYSSLRRVIKGDSFLLESVEGEEKISRYSFLGFKPLVIFKSEHNTIYIKGKKNEKFITKKDPLHELKQVMKNYQVWPKENIRFFGGFVGYAGYDLVRFYEPIGEDLKDSVGMPDTYFILPQFLIVFDHLKKEVEVLSFLLLTSRPTKSLYEKEIRKLKRIINITLTPQRLSPLTLEKKKTLPMKSNFKKQSFMDAVKQAKRYIREGEIIQVVLSQRFSVEFKKDPLLAYRYLRLLNPSPYMYYLELGDIKIVGASPEMLLRCEGGVLVTRPIAGTRKRGNNAEHDTWLEKDLLSDVKEKAEHIMLVDLARNDIGRVAQRGTVSVPIFMTIERFSHVMHIVSEVQGTLDKGSDMFRALEACFPAGTVSGAPKVRAMQIINELEKQRRGIYAGCIGYFSFTKALDTCIIIRTIVFKNKRAFIQAGAGIVADSQPAREYKETLNKARAQILALEMAA